jgi:hypothetical protein
MHPWTFLLWPCKTRYTLPDVLTADDTQRPLEDTHPASEMLNFCFCEQPFSIFGADKAFLSSLLFISVFHA